MTRILQLFIAILFLFTAVSAQTDDTPGLPDLGFLESGDQIETTSLLQQFGFLGGSDDPDERYFIEFKFGKLDPEDTGSGSIYGISVGQRIDSHLWYGAEVDYFNSTYRVETVVADSVVGGIRFRELQRELEFDTRILKLLGQISYTRRFRDTRNYKSPFMYRASGALGWEMIWNHEENFAQGISRQRFFHGLGWQLSTGLGLQVSERGIIFADLYYNNSTASRNQDRDEEGLPVWEQIDISGIGFKVGINIVWPFSYK